MACLSSSIVSLIISVCFVARHRLDRSAAPFSNPTNKSLFHFNLRFHVCSWWMDGWLDWWCCLMMMITSSPTPPPFAFPLSYHDQRPTPGQRPVWTVVDASTWSACTNHSTSDAWHVYPATSDPLIPLRLPAVCPYMWPCYRQGQSSAYLTDGSWWRFILFICFFFHFLFLFCPANLSQTNGSYGLDGEEHEQEKEENIPVYVCCAQHRSMSA